MMRSVALVLVLSLPVAASAEEIAEPKYASGDTWIYHQSEQRSGASKETDVEFSVARVDGDDLLVSIKPVGAAQPPRQRMFHGDWSQFRGIDGVETIVHRPLAFPLTLSKTWKVAYSEMNPSPGRARKQFDIPWKVVGWEDVTTPAGKFKALKIEAKGRWVADITQDVRTNSAVAGGKGTAAQSTQNVVQGARRVEGRLYHAVWYVPEVKRWVKWLDQTFSSTGEVSKQEEGELKAYTLEGAAPASPSPAAAKP